MTKPLIIIFLLSFITLSGTVSADSLTEDEFFTDEQQAQEVQRLIDESSKERQQEMVKDPDDLDPNDFEESREYDFTKAIRQGKETDKRSAEIRKETRKEGYVLYAIKDSIFLYDVESDTSKLLTDDANVFYSFNVFSQDSSKNDCFISGDCDYSKNNAYIHYLQGSERKESYPELNWVAMDLDWNIKETRKPEEIEWKEFKDQWITCALTTGNSKYFADESRLCVQELGIINPSTQPKKDETNDNSWEDIKEIDIDEKSGAKQNSVLVLLILLAWLITSKRKGKNKNYN